MWLFVSLSLQNEHFIFLILLIFFSSFFFTFSSSTPLVLLHPFSHPSLSSFLLLLFFPLFSSSSSSPLCSSLLNLICAVMSVCAPLVSLDVCVCVCVCFFYLFLCWLMCLYDLDMVWCFVSCASVVFDRRQRLQRNRSSILTSVIITSEQSLKSCQRKRTRFR